VYRSKWGKIGKVVLKRRYLLGSLCGLKRCSLGLLGSLLRLGPDPTEEALGRLCRISGGTSRVGNSSAHSSPGVFSSL
jgi:hypothetical protein